jgi:threonine dehydratase
VESRTLSELTGAQVFLKFENLQFTASFKERGACNKLVQLTPAERARGVIAMSAGNHAQGVAYHAQRLGIPATIVMPSFTPGVKVARTRGFGAQVILHGATLEEAYTHARQLADAGIWCSCTPTTTSPSWPARARPRWRCWRSNPNWMRWWCPSAAAG